MEPLDAFWHILNFFLPALGVGALAASMAKLVWRGELRGVRWRTLAAWAALAGSLSLVVGLMFFGRDGKMATYAVLIGAEALTLWWVGFRPRGKPTPRQREGGAAPRR